MKVSRREFIKSATMISTIVAVGGLQSLSAAELYGFRNKVKLRFIVASDAHYGQPDTPFEMYKQVLNYYPMLPGLSKYCNSYKS